MARWQAGAGERLERAALELFVEQGFAATTVPQITARAGLTTRTFFRYFADKREVLFAREDHVPALVDGLLAAAPAGWTPVAVISAGLGTFAREVFEGHREELRLRRAVIQADVGLRERELQKLDALAETVRLGFLRRGCDALGAALAAQLAVTVFRVGLDRWLEPEEGQPGDGRPLAEIITETFGALRLMASEPVDAALTADASGRGTPAPSS